MNNFCTLFDSHFLTRGLALYRSLEKTGDNFKLFVFCFDDLAFDLLQQLHLSKAVLIRLEEFETPELLKVKSQRTRGEYCWTCTSHTIRHVLERYDVSEVTYLDADLYFFQRPSVLLGEFHRSGSSILITEHRYTPKYDKTSLSGIYCVQFMTFKKDDRGLEALQWWQDRCLEWCYARPEDGKFGDQKYLDDWPSRFEGVHVLAHVGGGVAPWNIQQYVVSESTADPASRAGPVSPAGPTSPAGSGGSAGPATLAGPAVDGTPVVFFHFHSLRWLSNDFFDLAGTYRLSKTDVRFIYEPYLAGLQNALKEIRAIDPHFNKGKVEYKKSAFSELKRRLKGGHKLCPGDARLS